MTTITIERELLVRMEKELFLARNYGGILRDELLLKEVSAALAAPATAPEKTVQEIMEFARHYAANTFSSATLEDKIRRSLAAQATDDQLRKDAERYRYLRGQQHWSEALEKAIDAAIAKAEGEKP